jgi:hypothetical protein
MTASPSLLELQSGFFDAIFGRSNAIERWVDGAGLEPAARLRIYRNAVASTQIEALRSAYPAALALVGEDFFDAAATRFRLRHPSTSGNLQDFGKAFPEFLANMPEAGALDYLADVARLDWLRQESALAADVAPLDGNAMHTTLAANPARLWLSLHPSLRLLSSQYAALAIWQYSQAPTSTGLKLDGSGQRVIVWRAGQQVAMAELDAASFVFVEALADHSDIDSAHMLALAADNDFDLAACLRSLIAQDLISAYCTGDNTDAIRNQACY